MVVLSIVLSQTLPQSGFCRAAGCINLFRQVINAHPYLMPAHPQLYACTPLQSRLSAAKTTPGANPPNCKLRGPLRGQNLSPKTPCIRSIWHGRASAVDSSLWMRRLPVVGDHPSRLPASPSVSSVWTVIYAVSCRAGLYGC